MVKLFFKYDLFSWYLIKFFFAEKGILPEECKGTADIILFFDNLFDSINGSFDNAKKRTGKPLLGPLTPKSTHHAVWNESKPVLASMKFIKSDGSTSAVPSIKNWLYTIENIQYLASKLFNEHDLKSIWLRHLNQDPLENFFGCVRSHGFRNVHPTCAGFDAAFASLLINNLTSNHSPGSNCEMDSATAFKSLNKLFFDNNVTSSCAQVELNIEHITNHEIIVGLENKNDPRVKAELEYVAGYVLRNTKKNIFKNCEECRKSFYNENKDNTYIKAREHMFYKKCLTYPSHDFIKRFSDMQDLITHIIKSDSTKPQIKTYIKTVLHVILEFNFVKCSVHKKECIEYIFDLACNFFLCNWCREVNKILSGRRNDYDVLDVVQKMAHDYNTKRRK